MREDTIKKIYIVRMKSLWGHEGRLLSTKGKLSDVAKFKTLQEAQDFLKGIESRFYIVERTIETTHKRLDYSEGVTE
jgi:hypothetical protein